MYQVKDEFKMEKSEIIKKAKAAYSNINTQQMTNDEMMTLLEDVFNIKINAEALINLSEFFGQTKDYKTESLKLQWRLWTLMWLTNKLVKKNQLGNFNELMSVINQISK